jgi:Insect cuticle protein
MLTKFIVVVCFTTLAVATSPQQWEEEKPANYEFQYEVHDQHTGDIKRQNEKAENGKIQGQYSLVDPDG